MEDEAEFVSHLLLADETKYPADKHDQIEGREHGR